MTPEEIQRRVIEVLVKKLNVEPAKITPDTRLAEDLGVDSFGAVEIMFELEEAFSLKISDSDIAHIRTVKDIVAYLDEWLRKTADA